MEIYPQTSLLLLNKTMPTNVYVVGETPIPANVRGKKRSNEEENEKWKDDEICYTIFLCLRKSTTTLAMSSTTSLQFPEVPNTTTF